VALAFSKTQAPRASVLGLRKSAIFSWPVAGQPLQSVRHFSPHPDRRNEPSAGRIPCFPFTSPHKVRQRFLARCLGLLPEPSHSEEASLPRPHYIVLGNSSLPYSPRLRTLCEVPDVGRSGQKRSFGGARDTIWNSPPPRCPLSSAFNCASILILDCSQILLNRPHAASRAWMECLAPGPSVVPRTS